jgi:glycine/D-amino acid oxidase-like deaminating enzyme
LVAEQACLLPTSPDNTPLVGAVPGVPGLYVAAGHGCWGILMAPATGLAMAELLTTGLVESVDVGGLDPARLRR